MKTTVLESLNHGLLDALKADDRVLLLGEDILDPYGGAFKVTRGCSTAFPERVITTPISEAGITGITTGLALRGMRPVLEIMFGDFLTLTTDQLINHISKFRFMYNNTVELPLVIRTPMGGRRGYGPTHSQSLEKLFMGVPGLTILAPVNFDLEGERNSPGRLLERTILHSKDPVLFIENKLQYLLPLLTLNDLKDFDVEVMSDPSDPAHDFPVYSLKIKGAPDPGLTITAYGYMADLAREAMLKLAFESEIFSQLIIPTRLSPFKLESLFQSVRRTGHLLVVEEGTLTLGWGAEVVASVTENCMSELKWVKRLAARDTPIPAAVTLEKQTLPQVEDILEIVRKMDKNG